MGDITANFSRDEFALPASKALEYGFRGVEYPEEWVESRLRPLCRALEVLRDKLGGRRVRVISGYRPKAYDLARLAAGRRGVSPNSQHHDGRAADFQVEGVEPSAVYAAVLELYHTGAVEIGGLGVYDEFVHIDVRGGVLKTWDERTK